MNKKLFLLLFAVGPFLWGAARAFGQEQAPAPVHRDGQSWQYRITETHLGVSKSNPLDGIYEIRIVGEEIRVAKLINNQREGVSGRGGVLRELVGKNQSDDPDFKFPLIAGQKWSYQYMASAIGSKKKMTRDVEITVSGPEEVTTPAGTFRALKIRKEDGGARGQNMWLTIHYWSPETNSVVKSSYDSTEGGAMGTKREVELIKFTSKPLPPAL